MAQLFHAGCPLRNSEAMPRFVHLGAAPLTRTFACERCGGRIHVDAGWLEAQSTFVAVSIDPRPDPKLYVDVPFLGLLVGAPPLGLDDAYERRVDYKRGSKERSITCYRPTRGCSRRKPRLPDLEFYDGQSDATAPARYV